MRLRRSMLGVEGRANPHSSAANLQPVSASLRVHTLSPCRQTAAEPAPPSSTTNPSPDSPFKRALI